MCWSTTQRMKSHETTDPTLIPSRHFCCKPNCRSSNTFPTMSLFTVWSGGSADYSTEVNVAHRGPTGQVQRPDVSSLSLFESESRSVVSNSCDFTDCSPPGSSVSGILQTRILEWVAMPSSRGSSQPRDWTQVSHIAGGFFTMWATRKAQKSYINYICNGMS